MSDKGWQQFVRCPRCRKTWEMFSVYSCPSCGTTFCAACDLEDPGSRDLRWLFSTAMEMERCPVCTAEITELDKIGIIAGRNKQVRQTDGSS